MSATETPTPAPAEEQATRHCPRCAAPLPPQQEWCLSCGADVGSRVVAAPSWRGPVALVVGLLAIAAIALILAIVELAGDAEQVTPPPAGQAATPTATPSAAGVPTASATPDSITIPPATADEPTGTPEIADWPDGKDAWTVVLESSSTRAAAEARAKELAGQGVPVGILDSNGYSSLEPGHFVVFSGQYDSKRAADQALEDLTGQVTGGYVRHVIPSTATQHGGATVTPSPSPTSTTTPLTP